MSTLRRGGRGQRSSFESGWQDSPSPEPVTSRTDKPEPRPTSPWTSSEPGHGTRLLSNSTDEKLLRLLSNPIRLSPAPSSGTSMSSPTRGQLNPVTEVPRSEQVRQAVTATVTRHQFSAGLLTGQLVFLILYVVLRVVG